MEDFRVVQLSDWPMAFEVRPGYEGFRKIVELKPSVRKVNDYRRRSTSDPSRQEKD